MILICPRTGRQCGLTGCTAGYRLCDQWPQSISTMDDHSKSQVKRLVTQSPEYAAGYAKGREDALRDVRQLVAEHAAHFSGDDHEAWQDGYIAAANAILAALSKGE